MIPKIFLTLNWYYSGRLLVVPSMGHNCNSIEVEVVDLKHPNSKCMGSKFVEDFTASSSSIGGILQDHPIICGGAKVALIYFHTLRKRSAILVHSFSAWCWLPRRA